MPRPSETSKSLSHDLEKTCAKFSPPYAPQRFANLSVDESTGRAPTFPPHDACLALRPKPSIPVVYSDTTSRNNLLVNVACPLNTSLAYSSKHSMQEQSMMWKTCECKTNALLTEEQTRGKSRLPPGYSCISFLAQELTPEFMHSKTE
jgi:hypothetical protein